MSLDAETFSTIVVLLFMAVTIAVIIIGLWLLIQLANAYAACWHDPTACPWTTQLTPPPQGG